MRSGTPEAGDLYMTDSGRTVEIVAVRVLDPVGEIDTISPVRRTEVIAFRILGGSIIRIVETAEVQSWVKVPSTVPGERG